MPHDPEEIIDLVLIVDADKIPPPTFHYTVLTCRQYRVVATAAESLDKSNNAGDTLDAVFLVIKTGLMGWSDMGQEFDPAVLEDMLSSEEAMELMLLRLQTGRPSTEVKKKSVLQPLSEGG